MPIYEYECPKCGVFEVEQKISEKPLTKCPECEKNGSKSKVERIISASAFHLKGGGWYKSDYSSGKSTTPAKSEKSSSTESSSSEKKEDTKSDKSSLKTAPCGGGCKCN